MPNCKVVVFDLDDTLYPEVTFFQSGLKAVSKSLSKELRINWKNIYAEMLLINEIDGRGKIFDIFLEEHGIFTNSLLQNMISKYRNHNYEIQIEENMMQFLLSLKDKSKYIVTDGHKLVQSRKIAALKIFDHFDRIYITNRFGINKQKPSLYCFNKIANLEKTRLSEIIYIGDNPKKDFVNLNKAGAVTIQTCIYVDNPKHLQPEYNASYEVYSLRELKDILFSLGVIE